MENAEKVQTLQAVLTKIKARAVDPSAPSATAEAAPPAAPEPVSPNRTTAGYHELDVPSIDDVAAGRVQRPPKDERPRSRQPTKLLRPVAVAAPPAPSTPTPPDSDARQSNTANFGRPTGVTPASIKPGDVNAAEAVAEANAKATADASASRKTNRGAGVMGEQPKRPSPMRRTADIESDNMPKQNVASRVRETEDIEEPPSKPEAKQLLKPMAPNDLDDAFSSTTAVVNRKSTNPGLSNAPEAKRPSSLEELGLEPLEGVDDNERAGLDDPPSSIGTNPALSADMLPVIDSTRPMPRREVISKDEEPKSIKKSIASLPRLPPRAKSSQANEAHIVANLGPAPDGLMGVKNPPAPVSPITVGELFGRTLRLRAK